MLRHRSTFLFASALLFSSACQFPGCGQGCATQGSVSPTPVVNAESLEIPVKQKDPAALGLLWADKLDDSLQEFEILSGKKGGAGYGVPALRQALAKHTGYKPFAEGLRLSEPMGCVTFNAMDLLILPKYAKHHCVFHFKDGIHGLAQALEGDDMNYEDRRNSTKKCLGEEEQDCNASTIYLETEDMLAWNFVEWPALGKDAVFAYSTKLADLDREFEARARKAKAILKARQARPSEHPLIDLNVFVSNVLTKHESAAKGMMGLSRGMAFTQDPEAKKRVQASIDKEWATMKALEEANLKLQVEKEDLRWYLTQSLNPAAPEIKGAIDGLVGRNVGSHLLGVLPDRSFAVFGWNIDPRVFADKDLGKSAVALAGAQGGALFKPLTQAGSLLNKLAAHMTGPSVLSFYAPKPGELAMAWVYQLNKGSNARDFWEDRLPAVNKVLKEEYHLVLNAKAVSADGLRVDRYLPEPTDAQESELQKAQFDVGQVGDLAFVLASNKGSKLALEQLGQALQGKDRVAELPHFARMGALFAGNPLALAVDFEQLSKLQQEGLQISGKSLGLGQVSGAIAMNRAGGAAMELRMRREDLKHVATGFVALVTRAKRIPSVAAALWLLSK